MNWRNANDELPQPGRLLLICVNGNFHIARYSVTLKGFRLQEGSVYMTKYQDIRWIDIEELSLRSDLIVEKKEHGPPSGEVS